MMITTAKGIKSMIFILALALAAGYSADAVASEAGIVIAVKGEAGVKRDGAYTALKIKSPVFVSDVVETGPDGKVQILFNDDTSLSVAPSSSISLDEFVFDPSSEPSFSVKAITGISRVISGKIVERNPEGFRMNSPRASVGIRGTGVLVSVEQNKDVILLQHIGQGHNVLVFGPSGTVSELTAPGTAVDVSSTPGFSQNVYVMSQSQINMLNQAVSVITPKSEADNELGDAGTPPLNESSTQTADAENLPGPVNGSGESFYSPKDMNAAYEAPAVSLTASYSGVLTSSRITGTYGFNIDLTSLKVSDAYLSGSRDKVGAFLASGGFGSVSADGGNFSAGDFADVLANGIYTGANGAFMEGSFSTDGEKNYVSSWELSADGELLAWGTGEGNRVSSIETPEYVPANVTAFYEGSLNADNMQLDGAFGFALDLDTLGISDAYMTGSKDGTGAFLASGGTGAFSLSDYAFAVDSFATLNTNGRFNGATGASISGSLSDDGQDVSVNDWNLNYNGERLIGGSGEGSATGSIETPEYIPANVTAFYEGSLNADNMQLDGAFGFALDLDTLGISDAYMTGSKDGTGAFLASGGTGAFSLSDYAFAVDSFATLNTNGRFNGATGASISGSLSDDGQDVSVNDWNLNYNGERLIGGSGEGSATGSIETPEFNPALMNASYSGGISGVYDGKTVTGSFGMDIDLLEGFINNAFMYGSIPASIDTVTDSFLVNNGSGALDSSGTFSINNFNVYGNGVTNAIMNGTLKEDFSAVTLTNWRVFVGEYRYFIGRLTTEAALVDELPSASLLTGVYRGNLYDASGVFKGEYSIFMDFFNSEAYKIYVRLSDGVNGGTDLLISRGAGYMANGELFASFGSDTVISQGDSSLNATLSGSVLSDNSIEFIVRDALNNNLGTYYGGNVLTGPSGFEPSGKLTVRYEGTIPTGSAGTTPAINFYFDLALDSARNMSIENVTMYGSGDGFYGSTGFGSFLLTGGSGLVAGASGSYNFTSTNFTGSVKNPDKDIQFTGASLDGSFSADMMSLADIIAIINLTTNGSGAHFNNNESAYGLGNGQMVSGVHARFDGILTNGGVDRGNFGFDVNLNNGDVKNVTMSGTDFNNIGGFGTKGPDGAFRAEGFTNPMAASSSATGAFMAGDIHGNMVDVSRWQAVDASGSNFVSGDGGHGDRIK